MNILYGCSGCSDELFKTLVKDNIFSPAQKYHKLLMDGLLQNGVQVNCCSGLPINRSNYKKIFAFEKDDQENGVQYHYIKSINLPLFRQIGIFFGSFCRVLKSKRRNTFIICDCLNIATAYGMVKAARWKKIPIVFIVTDLPGMLNGGKIVKKINNGLFKKADGFIFLTEQMNEKVNPYNKPYIVLEGHVDDSLKSVLDEERYEYQDGKKIIIYAGSIKKLYGIQNLVEGFISAELENAELHIYGDGDYREELEVICVDNPSVKYMGIRPNDEIVREEQRAALLVNPRPTAPEYTKYSFPSKNMEYMVSGTPIMTTKLPGMPQEYYPFVYTIEDESVEGIAKVIKNFFDEDIETRYAKGHAAREFVLINKSNVVQAKKIIEFLQKEIKGK